MDPLDIAMRSWEDAHLLASCLSSFVFRGQRDSNWTLSTTLERSWAGVDMPDVDKYYVEWNVIDTFTRRAQQYINNPPEPGDWVAWLCLLQHHGGPTRLIDFTHSFYVAMFFAIETASDNATIWCINRTLQSRVIRKKYPPKKKYRSNTMVDLHQNNVARFLLETMPDDESVVVFVDPERMIERQTTQQGVFFMPSTTKAPFVSNLASTFGMDPVKLQNWDNLNKFDSEKHTAEVINTHEIVRILVSKDIQYSILSDLERMNVTAASLFPGLDGFARSLHYYPRAYKETIRL